MFFRFGYEDREGTRPLGATFGYPFPERSDGACRADRVPHLRRQRRRSVQGRNAAGESDLCGIVLPQRHPGAGLGQSRSVEILPPGRYIPPQGQMALPPDNDYHTVKGDLAWAFTQGPVRRKRVLCLDEAECAAAAADDRFRLDQRRDGPDRSEQLEHGRCAEPGHRARRDRHVQRIRAAAIQSDAAVETRFRSAEPQRGQQDQLCRLQSADRAVRLHRARRRSRVVRPPA